MHFDGGYREANIYVYIYIYHNEGETKQGEARIASNNTTHIYIYSEI